MSQPILLIEPLLLGKAGKSESLQVKRTRREKVVNGNACYLASFDRLEKLIVSNALDMLPIQMRTAVGGRVADSPGDGSSQRPMP